MLFSSFEFICIFLPVLCSAFLLVQKRNAWALGLLLMASFIFYANHRLFDLGLMISSILINFSLGKFVQHNKRVLILGLMFNIGVIGYFKYSFFIVNNLSLIFPRNFTYEKIILPLGVSFFTFQQIAYLVDTYRGDKPESNIVKYALLVSFFPHSIAGPLVQYKEISPQFEGARLTLQNLVIGGTIFIIGLFKKVVIADSLAPCANAVFDQISAGLVPTFAESWLAAISYTLQLYFDFSGYSDMAVGLARIFNIKFPVNFNSPYKSTSIIEFWRRWHITLSTFLRNYVYIPLGGNREGTFNRYRNLFLTMLIGGIWHGANWTFIVWGALHGIFLGINHLWREYGFFNKMANASRPIYVMLSWCVTMFAVVMAWVMFRSPDIQSALIVYKSMFGFEGVSVPVSLKEIVPVLSIFKFEGFFTNQLFDSWVIVMMIVLSCTIALTMPNIKNFFHFYQDSNYLKDKDIYSIKLSWAPRGTYAFLMAGMTALIVLAMMSHQKIDFLYFNF